LPRSRLIINFGIATLLLTAIVGLVWVNFQFTAKRTRSNDFAVYWSSARTLLFDGATPYGELASLKNQNLIYGLGGRPSDPPSRLDLPFHIELLILPFALITNFQMAQAIWMTILEIALVITAFVCFRTFRWSPNPVVGAEIIFFALFSVYGLWALMLGNAVILAGLMIAAALLMLREKQDEFAGILLALATFKFMAGGLFLLFILIWAAFHRRRRIFIPFIMTILILILISFFFVPAWFIPYIKAVFANLKFKDWLTPSTIYKDIFPYVGDRIGWVISGFLLITLMVEWWLARNKDFQQMVWTAGLTIAVTPFLGLPTKPQNYILLIIPLIFCFSIIANRWTGSSNYVISGIIGFLFVVSWVAALFAVNEIKMLFFALPIFTILILYWIRWWAVSLPRSKTDLLMKSL
jgi:hypothetical protein